MTALTDAMEPFLIPFSKVAVGVDLGQSHDPTSIAVIEERGIEIAPGAPLSRIDMLRSSIRSQPSIYYLRLLEQAPLGESYPAQAARLKRILSRQAIAEHSPECWIDYTGVGRAVADIFRQERVPLLKLLTITANGQAGPNGHGGHSVPKLDLVSRLQALMHSGRLRMPETLPLAKAFRRELIDFRVGYTAVGNATFGAREGAHDDLVLAVALAVYGLDSRREAIVEPLML